METCVARGMSSLPGGNVCYRVGFSNSCVHLLSILCLISFVNTGVGKSFHCISTDWLENGTA